MKMTPMPLDPNHIPGEAELLASLKEIVAQREELARLAAHLETLHHEDPWEAIARMTARPHSPCVISRRAAKARRDFVRAFLREREAIRVAGNWLAWPRLARTASRMGWSLTRLHLAVWLHKSHIVGVFDHRRDCARLQAWCGLPAGGPL